MEGTPSWGEYGVLLPLVGSERQSCGGLFEANEKPTWLELSSPGLSLVSPKFIASRVPLIRDPRHKRDAALGRVRRPSLVY